VRTLAVASAIVLAAGVLAMSASESSAASKNATGRTGRKEPASGSPVPKPAAGPGHHVALRGIRIYYEDRGRGPVLLLLHGGIGNGDQFSHQFAAFAPHYRLIVPDACAQGRTSDRPGPLTCHAMAEDVLALMDHLGVKTARVMGWSDGGVVGLDLASHHPERVTHLVTFGANTRANGLNAADVAWGDTATWRAFGEGSQKAYAERAPDPSHYAEAMTKILAMWRTDPDLSPERLGKIRAKSLICAGDHDVIRRAHTEEIAKAIPGAELWIVPDANHSVMIEKPDVVNPRVLEFLAR
jgi:pimeloyl-ACP methyl ester carboxylesterase